MEAAKRPSRRLTHKASESRGGRATGPATGRIELKDGLIPQPPARARGSQKNSGRFFSAERLSPGPRAGDSAGRPGQAGVFRLIHRRPKFSRELSTDSATLQARGPSDTRTFRHVDLQTRGPSGWRSQQTRPARYLKGLLPNGLDTRGARGGGCEDARTRLGQRGYSSPCCSRARTRASWAIASCWRSSSILAKLRARSRHIRCREENPSPSSPSFRPAKK